MRDREPVPFQVLISRILDRFQDLFGAAAGEVLDARLKTDLQEEAARVPLLADETDWIEVQDYSARSATYPAQPRRGGIATAPRCSCRPWRG